jgi:hypothetical protein
MATCRNKSSFAHSVDHPLHWAPSASGTKSQPSAHSWVVYTKDIRARKRFFIPWFTRPYDTQALTVGSFTQRLQTCLFSYAHTPARYITQVRIHLFTHPHDTQRRYAFICSHTRTIHNPSPRSFVHTPARYTTQVRIHMFTHPHDTQRRYAFICSHTRTIHNAGTHSFVHTPARYTTQVRIPVPRRDQRTVATGNVPQRNRIHESQRL